MTDTQPMAPARDSPVVVTLPAEIDIANALGIGDQLRAAMAVGVTAVIADMTATAFCDSVGMRMLILASEQAAANGTELRLLGPGPQVLRLMAILGVDRLLTVCPGLEEALEPRIGPAPATLASAPQL